MTRYILAALLVPLAMPQSPGLVRAPGERQILSAEAARVQAKRTADRAALDRLLTTDFMGVNRFGLLLGRDQDIALAGNPHYATTGVRLRLYADGAVVTGLESDEGEPPERTRFLRVWVRDHGAWRLLAADETAVTSQPELARLEQQPPSSVDRIVVDRVGVNANHVAGVAEAGPAEAREVRAVERAYRLAERANNLDALDRYQAPEFQRVDRLGQLVTPRAQPVPGVTTVNDEDFSIRVHGTIAVVVGDVLRDYVENESSEQFRYTAVWRRQADGWHIVAEQRTPVLYGPVE
jgi:ketosteroid isomerase-like protein